VNWELLGIAIALFSSAYLVPQIVKTIQTKRVKDISMVFLWYTMIAHFLWLGYNVYTMMNAELTLPYFINNLIRTISAVVMMIFYYKYK